MVILSTNCDLCLAESAGLAGRGPAFGGAVGGFLGGVTSGGLTAVSAMGGGV